MGGKGCESTALASSESIAVLVVDVFGRGKGFFFGGTIEDSLEERIFAKAFARKAACLRSISSRLLEAISSSKLSSSSSSREP